MLDDKNATYLCSKIISTFPVSIALINSIFFLGKLKDSVKDEIEDLVEKVNEKLDEIDNESKANAGHVDNLREVNKELLERIKVNVQDDIDKQTGK